MARRLFSKKEWDNAIETLKETYTIKEVSSKSTRYILVRKGIFSVCKIIPEEFQGEKYAARFEGISESTLYLVLFLMFFTSITIAIPALIALYYIWIAHNSTVLQKEVLKSMEE